MLTSKIVVEVIKKHSEFYGCADSCIKIVTNYAHFYAATMLTSKIIAEIIENYYECYGYANSCNKFVSSRS